MSVISRRPGAQGGGTSTRTVAPPNSRQLDHRACRGRHGRASPAPPARPGAPRSGV
jgi:hypothetical protein